MGAIIARIFAFIGRFKKISIVMSSIYLFSFIYSYFISLYLEIFIYHMMFIITWYFSFLGIVGTIFSWYIFLFLLPDFLIILKKAINLFYK